MTAMQITFAGSTYTLTTDAPRSIYGIPVLVAADGTQFVAGDIVLTIPAEVPVGEDWFSEMAASPARAMTARDVATTGTGSAVDGEAFRDADGNLTAYGYATAEMFRRFMAA